MPAMFEPKLDILLEPSAGYGRNWTPRPRSLCSMAEPASLFSLGIDETLSNHVLPNFPDGEAGQGKSEAEAGGSSLARDGRSPRKKLGCRREFSPCNSLRTAL